MGFVPWVGARGCTGGPQSGSIAVQAALLSRYGPSGAFPLGIYNCRRVGGSTSPWSLHAEGRAVDLGIPGSGGDLGDQVVDELRNVAEGCLQRLIWNRQTFDLASPYGRPYVGRSPHTDHIHIELGWECALGRVTLRLPEDDDGEDDPMPVLIVAYKGAQWAVSPDLTSRVGLSQSTDVSALLRVGGGRAYVSATLTESLMTRIPEVSAL